MSPVPAAGAELSRSLLCLMDEGVVVHDAGGAIVEANLSTELILGVPATRLASGSTLFPDDRPRLRDGSALAPEHEPARAVLAGGMPYAACTVRFRRPAGDVAWATLQSVPLGRGSQPAPGALTVILDVTETHALRRQLRGRIRMESLARLAAGVAQDFHQRLNSILAFQDALIRRLPDDEAARRQVEGIGEAARRGIELSRKLLAFSRREPIEPRLLALEELVTDLRPALERMVGGGIRLEVDVSPDLGTIHVDRKQLEQILVQLVLNARDAMSGVGNLRLGFANAELDDAFEAAHPGARAGRYVCLEVADNGTGIDPEMVDQVFEPFFSTRTEDQGAGLGLAAVYGIVKQNDGYIDLRSVPGEGTTVRVFLPRFDRVAARVY